MEVKKIVKFGPGGFYSKSQLISSNEGIQRKIKLWIEKFRPNHESKVQFQTRGPKARGAGMHLA